MSSILTNSSAMVALDTLRGINKSLANVQSEISTGKKISSSVDNAAIWSISTVMESDVSSFNQVSDSLNLGSATVGVARAGAESITEQLQDAKAKIVAANDPSATEADREKYQADLTEITGTIKSIVSGASFNGQNLISGDGQINVLGSLDRAQDGSVSTSSIEVNRVNLSENAAVSTLADLEATDGGYATVAGLTGGEIATAEAATSAASDAVITFDGTGALTVDDVFTVTLDNNTYTYTAVAGDDLNDVGAALAADINAAGLTGITAEFSAIDPDDESATLTISNSSVDPDDQVSVTVRAVDDAGDELAGVGATSISGLEGSGDITASVTFADGAIVADEDYTITVGAVDYTYTAVAGDDLNDVGSNLAELINDGGNAKLTASFTSIAVGDDAIIEVSYDADDADDQVSITSATDSVAVTTDTETTGIGVIAAATTVALDPAEATVTLAAGAVDTGTVFSLEVAGEEISYTAAEGDDLNTVGAALAAAINDAGITDVTASFAALGDPLTEDGELVISNASTADTAAVTLNQSQSTSVTTEAGLLSGLSELDVTTESGAADALAAIEGFLQSAIDASASFGSKQSRIASQAEFVTTLTDSLKTGIGAMTDANLEEASARLQSLQVQQQLGVQALSIANSGPQQLLALFR